MSEQTRFEIVGTRLQDQSKDKRSVRVIVAVDNIDDEKKERSLNDWRLRLTCEGKINPTRRTLKERPMLNE